MSTAKLDRLFLPEELQTLNDEWKSINKVDPSSKSYCSLISLLNALPQEHLKQLVEAKIKFVSALARNRVQLNA